MKPTYNISFRHGSHRIYVCDINRRQWNGGYYEFVRVATLPMNADDRKDVESSSYAQKLMAWHERRVYGS